MSMASLEGEHDDVVYAVLLRAGSAGRSLRELEAESGLRYRVLHNVTWRLEQQGRAHRLPDARPIRYVARTARRSPDGVAASELPAVREKRHQDGPQERKPATTTPARWTPHPDRDARRASAIRLAESVLAAEGLTLAHLRDVLSLAAWFYTQADGKWNTRYRSAAAVGAPAELLNHEHVVTRRSIVDQLLADPERCAETLQSAVGCCVLREEHRQLTALERTDRGLKGWGRYSAAGIEVIDLLTGRKLDLDALVDPR
jgi:hypothetical protein